MDIIGPFINSVEVASNRIIRSSRSWLGDLPQSELGLHGHPSTTFKIILP